MDELALEPRLIVYNLGYLPGGDKSLTTVTDITVKSVQKSLQMIPRGGAVSVTCYPGHLEGEKEEKALLEFCKMLNRKEWNVLFHQWINREKSPSLIWIEKGR